MEALLEGTPRPLWRLRACAAGVGLAGSARPSRARRCYDWGGGLVWLLSESDSGGRARGGPGARRPRDTLYRGEGLAFEPLTGPLAALTSRVKAAFDPQGVLNPGRMAAP